MKAFVKWWRNDNRQTTMCADVAAKDGWRAALEMVLNDIACKGGILQNNFVIRQCIREELEE